MPTLSTTELTKLSHTLGRALAVDDVNQLGRDTGQAQRLRTVTPHRLFLAMVSTLGSGRVESLVDLLRAFNHQNGVEVAYKAFYNRLARIGFATFMRVGSGYLPSLSVSRSRSVTASRTARPAFLAASAVTSSHTPRSRCLSRS